MFFSKNPLEALSLRFGLLLVMTPVLATAQSLQPAGLKEAWSAGSTASYSTLLSYAQAGYVPESLDLTQLRLKYADSPNYDPGAGSAAIGRMYRELDANDYGGALQYANYVLAMQYLNIDAHSVAATVYAKWSNDNDRDKAGFFSGAAKLHYLIARGLVRSIYASAGDGTNAKCRDGYSASCGTSMGTALKLISPQEEDGLARASGLRLVKRSSVKEGGRTYDVVNFLNTNDNSAVTLYFDVTLPEQHAERSLPR